jgi:hypothetical protein
MQVRRRNAFPARLFLGNKDTHDDRYGKIKYRNDRINFFSRRDEALLLVNRNDYTEQRIL